MIKSSLIDAEVGLTHRNRLLNRGATMAMCHSFSGFIYSDVIINEGNEVTMFDYGLKYGSKERYTKDLQIAGVLRKAKILSHFIECDDSEMRSNDVVILVDSHGEEIRAGKIHALSYYGPKVEGEKPVIVLGQHKVVFTPDKTQGNLVYQMREAMIQAMPDHPDIVNARHKEIIDYCQERSIDPDELTIEHLQQIGTPRK